MLHQSNQFDKVSLNFCFTKTRSNFLQGIVGKLWCSLCKNNTGNNPGDSSYWIEVQVGRFCHLVNLFTELANEKNWEISSLRMGHCENRKEKKGRNRERSYKSWLSMVYWNHLYFQFTFKIHRGCLRFMNQVWIKGQVWATFEICCMKADVDQRSNSVHYNPLSCHHASIQRSSH